MLHCHSLFQYGLGGVLGLLILHCASANPLTAGSRCNHGPRTDTQCADGLVCMPETPDSEISVCKVVEGCQLFGCRVESDECVCSTAADCTVAATQNNFTSLTECEKFIGDSNDSQCESERCPRVWCSPNLQYTPKGTCCPVCPSLPTIHLPIPTSPGCTEGDLHYEEGESWQRDACVSCTCEAGLPLCSSIQCAIPDCEVFIMFPGQCCPTCDIISSTVIHSVCEYGGQTYQDSETWNHNGDPCITCICDDGETLCSSQQCFVDCDNAIYLPNTCCPICPGFEAETTTHLPVPAATSLPHTPPATPPPVSISPPTTHCEYGEQVYEHGANWNPNNDPCTTCYCDEGFHYCIARSCYAACEEKDQVFLPGICCPLCPGDKGYPSQSISTPHPTQLSPSTTTLLPMSSSSSIHAIPSPTPLHDGDHSPVTEATTTRPETSTTPPTLSEPSATSCKDIDGAQWTNGESWCPVPLVKATCYSGTISYTEHLCPLTACQVPAWTAGSCNCPVCPDHREHVTVSVILDLDYSQYLKEEDDIRMQLEEVFKTEGLDITDIHAEKYGYKQTQVILSVSSSSGDEVLLEEDLESLQALLQQLKSPPVSSLRVGHHEEPKSITGISSPNIQSPSNQKNSQVPGKTTIIVVATVSTAMVVMCAVVIAVIVSRIRKIRNLSKTVTV